jgi:NAD(P)-dependent dehydrogenase (short-subunit alcohol dehydrogenase family)
VRREQDGAAIVAHFLHHAVKLLLVQRVQAAGGLIENQQAWAVHKGLNDADLAFVAAGILAEFAAGVKVQPGNQLLQIGLIDTAAICPYDDWMAEGWDDTLDQVIRANVKGPINLTRAFLPGMIAATEGRIVLCGSVAGWMGGLRSAPHYVFSKGGVHAFVRWLAQRGAPHNVLVNGIAPGPVDTGMTSGKGYEPQRYPLKRLAIPEEIGATALFLCSAAGGYASGAIFDINGGTHFH